MAWEFNAECNHCGHEWSDIFWHDGVGACNEDAHLYYCPQCFAHLSIAADLDRYSFRKWLAGNRASVSQSRILQHAVALINDAFARTSKLLLPHTDYGADLRCPSCECALLAGSIESNPIVCPQCNREMTNRPAVISHVSMTRAEDVED